MDMYGCDGHGSALVQQKAVPELVCEHQSCLDSTSFTLLYSLVSANYSSNLGWRSGKRIRKEFPILNIVWAKGHTVVYRYLRLCKVTL